jgi:hypothetical protein
MNRRPGQRPFLHTFEVAQTTTVSLTNVPMLSMSMVTRSPASSVNVSGGTSAV